MPIALTGRAAVNFTGALPLIVVGELSDKGWYEPVVSAMRRKKTRTGPSGHQVLGGHNRRSPMRRHFHNRQGPENAGYRLRSAQSSCPPKQPGLAL